MGTPAGRLAIISYENGDDIGMNSDRVTWYQANVVSGCKILIPQVMLIDSVNGPVAYNTGQNGVTNQLEFDINNDSLPGICSAVTPNGGNQAVACKYYPNF